MKTFTLTFSLFFFGLTNVQGQITESPQNISEKVYTLDIEDKEMLQAIEKAKLEFEKFEKAINEDNPNYKDFTLKKTFQSDIGEEHVWIRSVLKHPRRPVYVGIVASEPLYTKEVQFEDIIEISKEEITDWYYFDNGIIHGAFTTKLLRSRMSDEDQKKFDIQTNNVFKINY